MKKESFFVLSTFLFIIIVGLSSNSNAALVDNGNGTITDTDTNLMWLKDALQYQNSGLTDYYGAITFDNANTWADTLVYAGFDDWRLPSALNSNGSYPPCSGYNCTDSEMGHLYYIALGNPAGGIPINVPPYIANNTGPFVNFQGGGFYWADEVIPPYPNARWGFSFTSGRQFTLSGDVGYSALAVRTIVPEPISSMLFLTGGAILIGRKYLRRKRIEV